MENRRQFLTSAGAAALAAALARKAPAAPADAKGEWRNRQPEMAYRRLGRTGYMISEMVMGGNTIAPDNYEHVLMALDRGLNYLDTAPAYGKGRSELGYQRVLASRPRDQFFLNTKVSIFTSDRHRRMKDLYESLDASEQKRIERLAREEIERRQILEPDYLCNYFDGQERQVHESALDTVLLREYGAKIDGLHRDLKQTILDSVDQSLSRLKTTHVDLLMCPHAASVPADVTSHPEIFEAFEVLKKAGKARALGVSAHNDPAGILDAAVGTKMYSAAMVAYNVINGGYVKAALERAHEADFGVVAMKVARPVHHGRNNGRPNDPKRVAAIEKAVPGDLKPPQKAYVWALESPHVSAVISELINQQLVEENLPLASAKA